jgi:hypothetical protein
MSSKSIDHHISSSWSKHTWISRIATWRSRRPMRKLGICWDASRGRFSISAAIILGNVFLAILGGDSPSQRIRSRLIGGLGRVAFWAVKGSFCRGGGRLRGSRWLWLGKGQGFLSSYRLTCWLFLLSCYFSFFSYRSSTFYCDKYRA